MEENKMRQNYETSKLYYGFPVILLGYKDANFKYNFTTNSSSYTLGDMMVIGFHSRSNAAKQITNFKEFTVNVPSENLMNEIEIGGFFHKADKIPLSKLEYEIGEFVDAPLFTACPISIECKVENIVMYGETANVIASIKKRVVNSNLIEDGKLNSDKLNPVIFLGDEHERIYRYLRNLSDKAGKFYKNQFE
jgi:hypothetical protein